MVTIFRALGKAASVLLVAFFGRPYFLYTISVDTSLV